MPDFRININIEKAGIQRFAQRVRKVDTGGPATAKKVPKRMAERLKKEVVAILEETSFGETWNETNPAWASHWNRYDKPSARPGEPINSQSGAMIESIKIRETSEFGAAMDVTSPYARFHELTGWTSPGDRFIAQRPFVRPALERISGRGGELTEVAHSTAREEML